MKSMSEDLFIQLIQTVPIYYFSNWAVYARMIKFEFKKEQYKIEFQNDNLKEYILRIYYDELNKYYSLDYNSFEQDLEKSKFYSNKISGDLIISFDLKTKFFKRSIISKTELIKSLKKEFYNHENLISDFFDMDFYITSSEDYYEDNNFSELLSTITLNGDNPQNIIYLLKSIMRILLVEFNYNYDIFSEYEFKNQLSCIFKFKSNKDNLSNKFSLKVSIENFKEVDIC